jgi:lipid II isoglutaminyl synthase (glutamine-hydrolysing)
MTLKITVAYLYPEVMNAYGDHGNMRAIVRRAARRGIAAQVTELRIGDLMAARDVDMVVIGDGTESGQALICCDLAEVKGPAIREAVAGGAAALAAGGGYELFGRRCRGSQGQALGGIGVFDSCADRRGAGLMPDVRARAAARADLAIGDLVVRWGSELLVGFENHGGRTYLGPSARALGSVVVGHGNNGDGLEGVQHGNAIGTYLRGPFLSRNPALADFLLKAAVDRRHRDVEFRALPDDPDLAMHGVAVSQVLADHADHRVHVGRT